MFILIRGLGLNQFQTCFCSAIAYISTDANISYFNWQFCVANIINLEFYMTLWKRLHCNSLVKLHFYDKVDVTLLQWKDAYIFWGVLLQWETAKHEQLLFFFLPKNSLEERNAAKIWWWNPEIRYSPSHCLPFKSLMSKTLRTSHSVFKSSSLSCKLFMFCKCKGYRLVYCLGFYGISVFSNVTNAEWIEIRILEFSTNRISETSGSLSRNLTP